MRTTFALGAVGLAIASAVAPITSASAYCDLTYRRLTGYCNPCEHINDLADRSGPCPE